MSFNPYFKKAVVACTFMAMAWATMVFGSTPLKVITTIPDLAWVAAEIGGHRVISKSLLDGSENPHYVDAVPEFTRLAAEADMVCIIGLDLEVGYIPPVLARSGNRDIQPGGKGYCEVYESVSILGKVSSPVDRSMGDVHPHGNPHFYLSPKALGESAMTIAKTLITIDPIHANHYQQRLKAFIQAMSDLSSEISTILKPLKELQEAQGRPLIIEYHAEFAYFLEQFGLKSFGSIEEKPGVPPSAGRIGLIATQSRASGIKIVLASTYNPTSTIKRFSELSSAKTVIVPTMIQTQGDLKHYRDLKRHMALALVAAISPEAKHP